MTTVSLVARVVLATVFLSAAAGKLGRRREFEKTVRGYELVSDATARLVAATLPPLELVCGLLLVVGLATRIVALVLASMLLAFAGAVAVNLLRGREIDCGCLGAAGPRRITWLTVGRNLVFAAAALLLALDPTTVLSLDNALLGGDAAMETGEAVAVAIATTAPLASLALVSAAIRFRRLSGAFEARETA